jgi:BirA family biotin operon repressor/biotin-[acetyl-CoA-carboxylase] ligase
VTPSNRRSLAGASRPSPPFTGTQEEILRCLAAARGSFVSGQDLGVRLGLTRAAVAKAVDGLRRTGYGIDSSPHRGHRLVTRPDLLLAYELADGLETVSLGRVVHHYAVVGSTQLVARGVAEAGAPHGTIVIAEEQTAGRGRLGRAYTCPPGGLWCTLILRGPLPISRAQLVGLAAGVAAAETIAVQTSLAPTLKWPNDVLVAGLKVAGILAEMTAEEQSVHYLLVGAGININIRTDQFPAELRSVATSLSIQLGAPSDRRTFLQAYLLRLEQLYQGLLLGPGAVIDAWRRLPNTLGRRVRAQLWDGEVEGRAAEILPDGALLIEQASGTHLRVGTGDIVHIPETLDDEAPVRSAS